MQGWSKLGTKWKGVTIDHLIEAAGLYEPPAPSTAMERAGLLERERRSLEVPEHYGAYLRFIKQKGAEIYYNTTMALPYQIDPEQIDDALERWNCRLS